MFDERSFFRKQIEGGVAPSKIERQERERERERDLPKKMKPFKRKHWPVRTRSLLERRQRIRTR